MSENRFELKHRIKDRPLAIFTREMSLLLESGMQSVAALTLLSENQKDRYFSRCLRSVAERIKQGYAFSEALRDYPLAFSPLFIGMIAAGEESGSMIVMLRHLTEYYEGQAAIKSKILQALLYPLIVFFTAIVVVIFMMLVVVPIFMEVLESLNAELPASTEMLLILSRVCVIILPLFCALIIVMLALRSVMKDHPAVIEKWDGFCLRLPFVGKLWQTAECIRLSEVLNRLLLSGINLMQTLDICIDVLKNARLKAALLEVKQTVQQGYALSTAFERTGVFDAVFCQLLQVGEQSGSLEQVTQQLVMYYKENLERRVKTLSTVMEPVMLILVGLLVLFIVLSVMTPIYGIYENYLNMGM